MLSLSELLYLSIGLLTGLLSGVLGIGGGVIVVPALFFIFEFHVPILPNLTMHMAAGTSLAVMIFTSFVAVVAHHRIEPIEWSYFRKIAPGIALGTLIGVVLASSLPIKALKTLFALFLLAVVYQMSNQARLSRAKAPPSDWVNHFAGTGIGLISGMLGVGGGTITIPYLTYCGVKHRRIAPISSLCTFVVAFLGTTMFMLVNYHINGPRYSTGYVYWPAAIWVAAASMIGAPLGAKLSYILPVKFLRMLYLFILVMTILGLLV